MSVSYANLWKLLIDKKLKRVDLKKNSGNQQHHTCQIRQGRVCVYGEH